VPISTASKRSLAFAVFTTTPSPSILMSSHGSAKRKAKPGSFWARSTDSCGGGEPAASM
jgi:hypothetical protein